MHKEFNSKSKIDLSKLLQVKCLERPSDKYWENFQRELHHKTLQTIVQKQPKWWQLLRFSAALRCAFAALAIFCVAGASYFLTLNNNVSGQHWAFAATPESRLETSASDSEAEMSLYTDWADVPQTQDLGDPSFVVAAYTVEPEPPLATGVSQQKLLSSPAISSSDIRYAVGRFNEGMSAHSLYEKFVQ